MYYRVGTLRDAGLEARWSRTSSGAPILVARNPNASSKHQRERWWTVDRNMWKRMEETGVIEGFDCCTLLGDFFFV